MRYVYLTLLALVAILLAFYAKSPSWFEDPLLAEANKSFSYRSQPIHPGCVEEFLVSLSDLGPPRVLVVDVGACMESDKTCTYPVKEFEGFLFYTIPEPEESFGYRHLGTTSSGVHVLDSWENGGGTGFFFRVVLVKFERQEYIKEGFDQGRKGGTVPLVIRNRLIMRCLGQIGHGDRDDGKVALKGDRLILGRGRYREKDVVFDLSVGLREDPIGQPLGPDLRTNRAET